MKVLSGPILKHAFTTRPVPLKEMAGIVQMRRAPRAGDLVAGEVISVGKNARIEVRSGVAFDIFPGDVIVGAFGNRYATDQFEGYVPVHAVYECDLISVGGVCGEISSRHSAMKDPTRLRVAGLVADESGRPINLRNFGLSPAANGGRKTRGSETVLVVGSSMNSGKTTVGGTIARALTRHGYRVAAAKVTGTAAGKDGRYFEACGADPVLDFTSAGYPSTYMLELEQLVEIHRTLLSHLNAASPDYVVIEIADGILQRETRMMLECEEIRATVDHVFFAGGDSLSIECGARLLRELKLPLRAASGAVAQSMLAMREAEEFTGLPCLATEDMMNGKLLRLLGIEAVEDSVEACGAVL